LIRNPNSSGFLTSCGRSDENRCYRGQGQWQQPEQCIQTTLKQRAGAVGPGVDFHRVLTHRRPTGRV
jgi:hypothetical protein